MSEASLPPLSYSPGQIVELCTLGEKGVRELVQGLQKQIDARRVEIDGLGKSMFLDGTAPKQIELKQLEERARELGLFLATLGHEDFARKVRHLSLVWQARPGPQHTDFPDVTRIVTHPPPTGQNEWSDDLVLAYADFATVASRYYAMP